MTPKISPTIDGDYLVSGLMKDDEDNPVILPLQEVINLSRDPLLLMHKVKESNLANSLFTEAAALVKGHPGGNIVMNETHHGVNFQKGIRCRQGQNSPRKRWQVNGVLTYSNSLSREDRPFRGARLSDYPERVTHLPFLIGGGCLPRL
jgi:hypothetical protein